ncbi:hypothetical protein N431DRAFT_462396 [Stipitochalara longipes BDJ]|nr:hypothetical protein N431DRAFT_462396 [Stipitochalara longipes BDJ]
MPRRSRGLLLPPPQISLSNSKVSALSRRDTFFSESSRVAVATDRSSWSIIVYSTRRDSIVSFSSSSPSIWDDIMVVLAHKLRNRLAPKEVAEPEQETPFGLCGISKMQLLSHGLPLWLLDDADEEQLSGAPPMFRQAESTFLIPNNGEELYQPGL